MRIHAAHLCAYFSQFQFSIGAAIRDEFDMIGTRNADATERTPALGASVRKLRDRFDVPLTGVIS